MTTRRPLVLVSGAVRELPSGDDLAGAPETHGHAIGDVSGLAEALAGKQGSLGFKITVSPTAPAEPAVGDIWIW